MRTNIPTDVDEIIEQLRDSLVNDEVQLYMDLGLGQQRQRASTFSAFGEYDNSHSYIDVDLDVNVTAARPNFGDALSCSSLSCDCIAARDDCFIDTTQSLWMAVKGSITEQRIIKINHISTLYF